MAILFAISRYIYSILNLDSAAVFESVDECDIEDVQNFIRDRLYEILQSKSVENDSIYDDKHNSKFFGLFSSMRNKFQFTIGDKKKLKLIKKRVEETVKIDGNYTHFDMNNKKVKALTRSWETKLTPTPAGLFFSEVSDNNNSSSDSNTRNINDLKESLVAKAKTKFESYKTLKKIRDFDDKSILVTTESGKYKGTLNCLFCEDTIGVNYQIYENSGSWLFSNLHRHMNSYHLSTSSANASRKLKRLAQIPSAAANKQVKHQKFDETQNKTDEHSESQCCSMTDKTIEEVVKKNNSILAIDIEPQIIIESTANHFSEQQTDLDELEDAIYLHCAKQIIKMKNCCILNNEKVIDFYAEHSLTENSTSNEVKCCRIKGDGHCLFASIAHQMFQVKINSVQHAEYTGMLREKAVCHIKTHLPRFIHCLRGRVYEDFENGVKEKVKRKKGSEGERQHYDEEILAQCNLFINETLAGGCWGGTESIIALSEIYKINILFIEENGKCNIVRRFDKMFSQSIILAYRRRANHYESIVAMDNSSISHFVKNFVKGEIKPIEEFCEFIIDSDSD